MSLTALREPTVEVHTSSDIWQELVATELPDSHADEDPIVGQLYDRLEAEYRQIDFGNGTVDRSPLREIHPV
jgi:hypothetical protein